MDKITSLRKRIDLIDSQLMQLLEERYHLTKEVGTYKIENSIEVLDSKREDAIYDKISKFSHSPQIVEVYRTIMNQSKNQQRM